MEITEKVAYLKGLVEGLGVDTDKKEGKILAAIVDILDDMALELQDMNNSVRELGDGLDAVSDDLEDVEKIVYGEDDDEDDDAEDFREDEEDCYATTCPNCKEIIYFDEDVLADGEILCPNCGEKLEFDLGGLEEDDGDGSGEE